MHSVVQDEAQARRHAGLSRRVLGECLRPSRATQEPELEGLVIRIEEDLDLPAPFLVWTGDEGEREVVFFPWPPKEGEC